MKGSRNGWAALSLVVVVLMLTVALATAKDRPTTQPADESGAAAKPAVVALKFHADWCGSCKAMGPVFEDLRNKLDGEPVLFVTLDLTNRSTAAQAEYHAAALGAGRHWSEYGGKTGFILLLDAQSGDVLGKLTREQDIKAMGAAIKSAVQRTEAEKGAAGA